MRISVETKTYDVLDRKKKDLGGGVKKIKNPFAQTRSLGVRNASCALCVGKGRLTVQPNQT